MGTAGSRNPKGSRQSFRAGDEVRPRWKRQVPRTASSQPHPACLTTRSRYDLIRPRYARPPSPEGKALSSPPRSLRTISQSRCARPPSPEGKALSSPPRSLRMQKPLPERVAAGAENRGKSQGITQRASRPRPQCGPRRRAQRTARPQRRPGCRRCSRSAPGCPA